MEVIGGVYCIRNILNNKRYIGSTINFKKRWFIHRDKLNKKIHLSRHLQSAWDKYGESSFIFEVLEECNEEKLIVKEQYCLDYYKSYNHDKGYNVRKIAESNRGIIFSDEHRRKIGEAHRGRHHTEETRKKLSIAYNSEKHHMKGENNSFFGKHHSEETKIKISKKNSGINHPNFGKKCSEERRRKIGDAQKGKRLTEDTKRKISEAHKNKSLSLEHKKKISEKACKGENSCLSKLTWQQIREIRRRHIPRKCGFHKLAKEYKVSPTNIMYIINRKTWIEVENQSG